MAGRAVAVRSIKRALDLQPSDKINYIIAGRVSKIRSYRLFNFIDLIDGSTPVHLQTVINRDLIHRPDLGSYLICEGNLVKSRGAKQPLEFKVQKVNFLGPCDPDIYPLASATSEMTPDFYRRWPHLRTRTPHFAALLRVLSDLDLSFHLVMRQMGFLRIYGPSMSSNDSEANSDLFLIQRSKISKNNSGEENRSTTSEINPNSDSTDPQTKRIIREGYFGKDVYLSTSAQLHLEMLASDLSRVYTLEAAFRAEGSISTRHLCKFHMFELEEANILELEFLMNRAESLIKSISKYLSQEADHKLDFNTLVESNDNLHVYDKLVHSPYIRMDYKEALQILRDKTDFNGNTNYGSDIGRPQEKELLKYCDNVPIFITNYPKQLKPFYMKCDPDGQQAQCFDLITPFGGELAGGSLREDSIERLEKNLRSLNSVGNQRLDWYLDTTRRFGTFPHGGFGIGIERFVQTLLGIKNIKDTTPFPRWVGHCPM